MRPSFRVLLGVVWLGLLVVFVVVAWSKMGSDLPFYFFVVPGYGSVGALLAARRPHNPVGWLLLTAAVLGGLSLVATWLDGWRVVFPVMAGLFGLFLLVFPDGALPSRRWRFIPLLVVAGCLTLALFSEPPPFATALFVLSLLACAFAPLVRYRHGRDVERLQARWPALAVGVAAGSGVTALLAHQLGAMGAQAAFGLIALVALAFGIPAAIAVAILRYRLYEIDRLISRTLSYALVVGFSAAVFFGVVTGLTALVSTESNLTVAGSTLAVAALFNPMRRRIQTSVDRRFNRSRYDVQRVMDGFVGSLRDQVDAARVVDGWVGVVSETMQPSSVAVWTKSPFRNDSETVAN